MKINEFDNIPFLNDDEVAHLISIRSRLRRFNDINKEDYPFLLEILDSYLFSRNVSTDKILWEEELYKLGATNVKS